MKKYVATIVITGVLVILTFGIYGVYKMKKES